jgi:hypothetical protein
MFSSWSLPLRVKGTRSLGSLAGAFVIVFFSFAFISRPALADNCDFNAGVDNDFNTAGNWTCGAVPTPADAVFISSGQTVTMSASATINSLAVSGTLDVLTFTLQATSTVSIDQGAYVSSTSGIMQFQSVTSTGSLGTLSGGITVTSTFQNNGYFSLEGGSATTTGDMINAFGSTLVGGGGTFAMLGNFNASGTFSAATGTVRFAGSNAQYMEAASFYDLTIAKGDGTVATMAGDFTVTDAFLFETGLFDVGTQTLTVSGSTYTNSGGQVLISSGGIISALTSFAVTQSDGTATSTVTAAASRSGDLYITLEDHNLNLSATNTETIAVTIAGTSASGSDSESVTLTETGVATGIFRNSSALPLSYVINATANDGTFSINASDTGTASYTDTYDATDTGSDTITLTYVAGASSASSASTGSGGLAAAGGGSSGGLVPLTTQYQEITVDGTSIPVHTLAKLACPAGAAVNDPCKAVYYLGTDGKRHAFPNDKVYFTWYADFSGVQLISESQMAGITLGNNVTYKPGVKMVKFTTDPKVYAVEKGGLLRWVTTEAVAVSLYGSSWNTIIDDINDAFYANYRFGNDISTTADYNAATAMASVTFPSDSLQP